MCIRCHEELDDDDDPYFCHDCLLELDLAERGGDGLIPFGDPDVDYGQVSPFDGFEIAYIDEDDD